MISLDTTEARVIGALLEKESTTPDQYPLSLNGLTTACNQKSNREPVMALSESEVLDALERLKDRNLVAEVVFGSRVAKYKHRFCNNEFSVLKLTKREAGIICVLLLRGPQTPGELRSRTARLCEFSDVGEVEQALEALLQRESGPLVERLAREPGRRESRYRQLFTPADVAAPAHVESVATAEVVISDVKLSQEQRIVALESELATLRADFDALKAQWDAFNA